MIIDIYDLETVTAHGEGLERGVKGEVSQFYVRGDSIGQGQVAVSVEGELRNDTIGFYVAVLVDGDLRSISTMLFK